MGGTDPARAVFAGTIRIGPPAARGSAAARHDAKFQKVRVRPVVRNIAGILGGILPLMFASAFNANAAQLITNGGFATSLAGWTVTSSAGSGGSWFQDSTIATPLTGMPTVGPASGSTGYAVTDQVLPGVNALSQDYTVPIGTTSLTLTFDMFINDWASATGSANIQVLVLSASSNPVTGTGTVLFTDDILVSGGIPNPYFPESLGIIGFVPTDTYILDFLETDTKFNMNVGLDDVALNATTTAPPPTPEPRSVLLLLSALVVMGALGWRRHQGRPLAVLAALALLSQPVHAQNANVARPLVPRSALGPGDSRPHIWEMSILDPAALVHGPGQTNCNGTGNACYYFPKDVNTAYTTSFISNGNGGTGITVAVVDAYYNTQTESDLGSYISGLVSDFGQSALPACTIADGCLTIVGQTGGAPPAQPPGPPFADSIAGWFTEENLDVQWVHSIAPNAKILLVIANSASDADLYTAVEYAKANADVVSNSWGGDEFSGETTDDSVFSSTVPVLFSAGDTFAELEYPCTSPNVTCVGGTNLLETATSHRNVEAVWNEPTTTPPSGTGGGCSVYESEPPFQSGFSTCGTVRGVPDIAAIADPYTGVVIYKGFNATDGGTAGFYLEGGTSLAAPVMAAIVANIDNSRLADGKTILGGIAPFNLGSYIYAGAGNPFYHYRFYDVTTGTDAAPGWDTATGLGVTFNPALTGYLNSLP